MRLEDHQTAFNAGVDDIPLLIEWNQKEYNILYERSLCSAVAKRLFVNVVEGGCLRSDSIVKGFTEYQLDGQVLRAHPCYRSEKGWFDWALVQWEGHDELIPAKLCMFLDLRDCHVMNEDEHQEFCSMFDSGIDFNNEGNSVSSDVHHYLSRSLWVVVQSCLTDEEAGQRGMNPYRVPSNIATRYYLEQKWRLIPLETVKAPAFCIVVSKDGNDVVHVHPKHSWKDHFLSQP